MTDSKKKVSSCQKHSVANKERGATMIEYALIIVVIALVAVIGAKALGGNVSDLFADLGNSMSEDASSYK